MLLPESVRVQDYVDGKLSSLDARPVSRLRWKCASCVILARVFFSGERLLLLLYY